MADKSTRLILDALTRAAAEPGGLPLFALKGRPALFPATAAARAVAQRCQDEGLIHYRSADSKASNDVATITNAGLDWLLSHSSPRQVLEDFLRVLEQKQARTAELIVAARQMAAGLESLHAAVERLAPRLAPSDAHHVSPQATARLEDDVPRLLEQWRSSSSGDCPLPELYRRLAVKHPALSVGRFHDALRRLHEEHCVYLHPWTGPLYDLPEPPMALLVGHEIAYYASPKENAMTR